MSGAHTRHPVESGNSLGARVRVGVIVAALGSGAPVFVVLLIGAIQRSHDAPSVRSAAVLLSGLLMIATVLIVAVLLWRRPRLRRSVFIGSLVTIAAWGFLLPAIADPAGVRLPWTTASTLPWRLEHGGREFETSGRCLTKPTAGLPRSRISTVRGVLTPDAPVLGPAHGFAFNLYVELSPSCYVLYGALGGP